jgi:hypothetical protein
MTTPIHPDIPSQKFACSVFLAEVPLNLADTPDGADYIGYYCGIECYAEFAALNRVARPASPADRPSSQK